MILSCYAQAVTVGALACYARCTSRAQQASAPTVGLAVGGLVTYGYVTYGLTVTPLTVTPLTI